MNKPQVGDIVEFMGKNAFEFQLEQAMKILTVGKRYTVSEIFMDKWGIYVYLNEAPRKTFRAEMFALINSAGGKTDGAKKKNASQADPVLELVD